MINPILRIEVDGIKQELIHSLDFHNDAIKEKIEQVITPEYINTEVVKYLNKHASEYIKVLVLEKLRTSVIDNEAIKNMAARYIVDVFDELEEKLEKEIS